jgi:hypothetical protein
MHMLAELSVPDLMELLSARPPAKAQANKVSNIRDANRHPASVRTNSSVSSPTTAGDSRASSRRRKTFVTVGGG